MSNACFFCRFCVIIVVLCERRALTRAVCTCAAGERRTQHFGYGTVAVPATLLCSHGLLQMQRFLLPLCVGMWLRDLLEILIKLH